MLLMDPADFARLKDREGAEAERRFLESCPACVVCGQPITDDECYCITKWTEHTERMLSCVHKACFVRKINAERDQALAGLVYEVINEDYAVRTPHYEREGLWHE